jgi:Predicted transcriptional regulator
MEQKIIQASAVRDLCGGISDMTLWRWLNDQAIAFPRPIYLGRRRYWREAEVLAWLDAR